MNYFIFTTIDELIEIISAFSGIFAYIGGLGQDNLRRFMAYSSISMAANIFFSLITGVETQYDDIIFIIIVYVISTLILLGLFSLYYNYNYIKRLGLANNFPKSNLIEYLLNTNKYYILVFLVAILLINGFPPFVSFGLKFIISIDFISTYSNVLVITLFFFTLIGFLFYINMIIQFFNNTKSLKNTFFYVKGFNPFILSFLLITLFTNIFIFNLDLYFI
jgi:NADH-quinone oxidoreductase subunit N